MVSFQRMRDDLDDLGTQVTNKLPAVGKTGCIALVGVAVLVLFAIGFAIGYSSNNNSTGDITSSAQSFPKSQGLIQSAPHYVFVSNNSYSCPELIGDRLLVSSC